MGQRFRKESSYAKHLRDNSEQMANLAKQMIDAGTALVDERNGTIVGMLLYIIFDHFMSGDRMGIEVAWWMEPEHRGNGLRLVIEFKKRAKAAGAKFYQMISPNKDVEALYQYMGMWYVESAWQGEL